MNDYQTLLTLRTHRLESERQLRNGLLVAELREADKEKAQPRGRGLRFQVHLLHWSGLRFRLRFRLRLRRQPRCSPLNAH